jgi:hypothetical protein
MFNFCKPVSSKKRFLPFRQLDAHFSFSLYEKAGTLPVQDWEAITGGTTIFLEKPYLEIAERGEYTRLGCRYVIVYHKQKAGYEPCGIIYFQVADFKAGILSDLLAQAEAGSSRRMNLFEKYIDSNKEEVLLRLFTCGNNLVSGEYGYRFDKKIGEKTAHQLLLKITDLISKEEKLRGTISAILIKDFYHALQPESLFREEKYSPFFVEPNLVVELPAGLDSLAEYTALFSKKYRNRAKSVLKNLGAVQANYLDLAGIKAHEKTLYALYTEVFEKAKFKLIQLPQDYFSSVKAAFSDRFLVKGYFLDGRMIAFSSSFLMPDGSLEAHYIGLDYALNSTYNLYQNLLYAFIEEAILNQCRCMNLGRTAAEIKTTVGAKAKELMCYIRPQNTISKIIQKPFISLLQPAEWTPRNPFKEEGSEKNNEGLPPLKGVAEGRGI